MEVHPDRIIITETEETYYQIKVVTKGTKTTVNNVEICAVDKILNNKTWTREHFMVHVPKLKDRIYFAGIVQEMTSILHEHEGEIIQIVYETDVEKFTHLKELGHHSVISENSGMTYWIRDLDNIERLDEHSEETYENISGDVSHIDKHFEFHNDKIAQDPLTNCIDHIVNPNNIVVFLGFSEQGPVVREFNNSNYLMNADSIMSDCTDDVIKSLDDVDENKKVVLVVSPFRVDDAVDVINILKDRIKTCVYDTDESYESVVLLSTCKRYKIFHCKKTHHHKYFNLGVVNDYEKCDDGNPHNGVITMNSNVWVGNKNFIIFLDPRYADISMCVSTMELCPTVRTISIIHDISERMTKYLYEYKFLPFYQTNGFTDLHRVVKHGLVHSPVAVYTRFPSIARMLFDAGIFVSCDKKHFLKYVDDCNGVFEKYLDENFIHRLKRVIESTKLASDMKHKIELVKFAFQKYLKKKVVHDIVYKRQEQHMINTLNELMI